jgi:hypothetical protein
MIGKSNSTWSMWEMKVRRGRGAEMSAVLLFFLAPPMYLLTYAAECGAASGVPIYRHDLSVGLSFSSITSNSILYRTIALATACDNLPSGLPSISQLSYRVRSRSEMMLIPNLDLHTYNPPGNSPWPTCAPSYGTHMLGLGNTAKQAMFHAYHHFAVYLCCGAARPSRLSLASLVPESKKCRRSNWPTFHIVCSTLIYLREHWRVLNHFLRHALAMSGSIYIVECPPKTSETTGLGYYYIHSLNDRSFWVLVLCSHHGQNRHSSFENVPDRLGTA